MDWILFLLGGLIIGWIISEKIYTKKQNSQLSADYFRGLNFIINEEQDKAISVFSQIRDNNPETIETQISLGALFRRRGESSKAIAIHKSLLENDKLSTSQKQSALLELGRDYMKAGMLDRAIQPFLELLKYKYYQKDALIFLSEIYEQEKAWDKAIDVAEQLCKLSTNEKWQVIRSHYWCEKAQLEIEQGNYKIANELLNKSLQKNSVCARANIIKAELLQIQEKHQEALAIFKKIETQHPSQIPEILAPMLKSYEKVATDYEVKAYMRNLLKHSPSTSLILALADKIKATEGLKEAEIMLASVLKNHLSIRGLEYLISLNLEKNTDKSDRENLKSLQIMMSKLQEEKSIYKCRSCGFEAQKSHWQCPGCRNWSTIELIVGVSGE